MTTALEAAAQALFEATTPHANPGASRPVMAIFEAAAKAVILAIREPTSEMYKAGASAIPGDPPTREAVIDFLAIAWKAMIDEAVK